MILDTNGLSAVADGDVTVSASDTIEIPDALFRRAKSAAAEQGIPLRALVSEALTDKLRPRGGQDKPWMKTFGKRSHLLPPRLGESPR